ncbi:MAG: FG-GAP repeat protein [Sphingomonadaceae bacterium]|nr:FG-GAP repeat protein [Sphingomonadaceae bacterium]
MADRTAFILTGDGDFAFRFGHLQRQEGAGRVLADEFRLAADASGDAAKASLSPIASDFPAAISLAALDGTNGFRIDGIDPNDRSGRSVASAGDVNGDGFDDIIIGAFGADSGAGESYIVFGKAGGFAASLDPASLDGSNGFRLDGIDAGDYSGFSVASAGDVNGDGFDDVIIGAYLADPVGLSEGESYVVFGRAGGFGATLDLASLDGSNGFRLDGIDVIDDSGRSVSSAGDVNGDGFDDILIGARGGDPGGDSYAGETYVVFGSGAAFAAAIDLASLDGTNGFRIDGIDSGDQSGRSVASAGDVNGDGFDDLIIGAYRAYPNGDAFAGESYVVFGSGAGFAASIDLAGLDGANGFRLDGIDPLDRSGRSVASAGDVNGDGFDDVIVGALFADPNGDSYAGESYVVFGSGAGFAAAIDLAGLHGTNGFRIDGIDANDQSGISVASAGDVNGDGFDDVVIGASAADSVAGESYVVFGKADGFAASLDLATLNGTNGFRIDGIDANDVSGDSVSSAGDVNGDGFDDLVVGASSADPNGDSYAGESYVIFGRAPEGDVRRIGTQIAQMISGGAGDDTLEGLGGNDTLRGLDGDDEIEGGSGADRIEGGFGGDAIEGGSGDDLALGGTGSDEVSLGSGNDSAEGSTGEDTLTGEDGNDTLAGGAEADVLIGGAGIDVASYAKSTAPVAVDLAAGAGTVGDAAGDVLSGIEQLIGSKKADVLAGDALANVITGGKGSDSISGRDGADTLTGSGGADTLAGGAGADVLNGLGGADRYVLASTLAADADSLGFAAGDQIALEDSVFGLPPGALAPSAFRAGTSAQDANDRIIYKASIGKLWFDADGSGAGAHVLIATLAPGTALAASDFIVI